MLVNRVRRDAWLPNTPCGDVKQLRDQRMSKHQRPSARANSSAPQNSSAVTLRLIPAKRGSISALCARCLPNYSDFGFADVRTYPPGKYPSSTACGPTPLATSGVSGCRRHGSFDFCQLSRQQNWWVNPVPPLLPIRPVPAFWLYSLRFCRHRCQTIGSLAPRFAGYYLDTYQTIRKRILSSPVLQVDETKANVQGKSAYVWMLASLQEVLYIYSDTREGGIIQELLSPLRASWSPTFMQCTKRLPVNSRNA